MIQNYQYERYILGMLNKKIGLCIIVSLLFLTVTACVFMNRVFAFDDTEITKITINYFEITDSETITEIANMFAKINATETSGTKDESQYEYEIYCYNAKDKLVQYFLCDTDGALYKPANYNDPDIFNLNSYYYGYLNYEDLERIKEIIE